MKKTLDSNVNPHEETKSKGNNIEKHKEQYKYIFCSKHIKKTQYKYASNNRALKYMQQKLTELKGEIEIQQLIVVDFDTHFE